MNKDEISRILNYLLTAYPNPGWGSDKKQLADIRTLWEDILKTFPYDIAQEACKAYIFQGGKFFPSLGEFVKLCDELWQKQEDLRRKENSQAERDATRMLFHEPVHSLPYGETVKQAVQLIRDVTEYKIKYNSPEWQERYSKIFAGVKPKDTGCLCDDGLVFYTKDGYSYTGSCSWCGRGNKNYPVINPETLQREEVRKQTVGAGR